MDEAPYSQEKVPCTHVGRVTLINPSCESMWDTVILLRVSCVLARETAKLLRVSSVPIWAQLGYFAESVLYTHVGLSYPGVFCVPTRDTVILLWYSVCSQGTQSPC